MLIVINFQSWQDPFIIITALPAALAGIVWMLFLTGTTVSVPALTGAIMCMGVATANSILIVSFARTQLANLLQNPSLIWSLGPATGNSALGNLASGAPIELSAIDIRTRYQVASVQLIKALGGGWQKTSTGPLKNPS